MPRTPGSSNWDRDEIFVLLDAFDSLSKHNPKFKTKFRETQAHDLHIEITKLGVIATVEQVESKMKRLRKNLVDLKLPGVLLNLNVLRIYVDTICDGIILNFDILNLY
jgi:hypothetical protein